MTSSFYRHCNTLHQMHELLSVTYTKIIMLLCFWKFRSTFNMLHLYSSFYANLTVTLYQKMFHKMQRKGCFGRYILSPVQLPRDASRSPDWLMVPAPGLDRLRRAGTAPASQTWQHAGCLEREKEKSERDRSLEWQEGIGWDWRER